MQKVDRVETDGQTTEMVITKLFDPRSSLQTEYFAILREIRDADTVFAIYMEEKGS